MIFYFFVSTSGRSVSFFLRLRSIVFFFVFKKKTAYEMRSSDWSSDVCSSDLHVQRGQQRDECERREIKSANRRSHGRGKVQESYRAGEQCRRRECAAYHCRHDDCPHPRFQHLAHGDAARQLGHDNRTEDSNGSRLRRSGKSCVDTAQNTDDQEEGREEIAQRPQTFLPVYTRRWCGQGGIKHAADRYQARKESPEDESGNYAGREELRDGSLRYQAVDYHRDRRGHPDADRARDCNRAAREIGIVAATTKHGTRHSPHGGGRCDT